MLTCKLTPSDGHWAKPKNPECQSRARMFWPCCPCSALWRAYSSNMASRAASFLFVSLVSCTNHACCSATKQALARFCCQFPFFLEELVPGRMHVWMCGLWCLWLWRSCTLDWTCVQRSKRVVSNLLVGHLNLAHTVFPSQIRWITDAQQQFAKWCERWRLGRLTTIWNYMCQYIWQQHVQAVSCDGVCAFQALFRELHSIRRFAICPADHHPHRICVAHIIITTSSWKLSWHLTCLSDVLSVGTQFSHEWRPIWEIACLPPHLRQFTCDNWLHLVESAHVRIFFPKLANIFLKLRALSLHIQTVGATD